ncbi:helix-turn-helix domain-containing protein [Streptomyces prasinus]|uniref:helix-turn-helix domain-containing protein n=1 Tax=Streptomyces prasinus TaxID=67345 RepID=UPI0033B9CC8E
MTINHRDEAEKHLANAARHLTEHPGDMRIAEVAAAIGQGHAALAAGQNVAADATSYRHTIHTLRFALIRHVAEGLALSATDEAHQHARGLAQYLDSVGLNIDREVDAHLEEHCGMSSKQAWKTPTQRNEEFTRSLGDPWANPTPRDETTSRRDEALKAAPFAWEMLGRAIRRERERQQLSRRALSERAEVSEKAIQTAEEGRVPASRWPQSLNRITNALGMGPGATVDIVLSAYPDDPPF